MTRRNALLTQSPRWKIGGASTEVVEVIPSAREDSDPAVSIISHGGDDQRAVAGLRTLLQTEELGQQAAGVLRDANVSLGGDDLSAVVSALNKTRNHYQSAFENLLEVGRALVSIQNLVGVGGYRALERARLIPIGEATASKLRQIALAFDSGKIPEDLRDRVPRSLRGAYLIASLPGPEVVPTMQALIDRQLLPDSPVSRLEGEIKSLRGRAPRSRRSELELAIDRKRRARDALDREIAELEASLRSLSGGDPWGQEDNRQTNAAATDG